VDGATVCDKKHQELGRRNPEPVAVRAGPTAVGYPHASKFGKKGKGTVGVADFAHDERESESGLLLVDGSFAGDPEIDFSW
jgi:hypothetical protein